MKTFEQACAKFQSSADPREVLADTLSPRTKAELQEINSRFAEIIQEMYDSKATRSLVQSLILQVGTGRIDPSDALYNAFAYGLMVGIEMEKP